MLAVGGENGRVQGDPVFEWVTEGRSHWPKYSACADLAHWLFMLLGCRDERFMNRSDDGGVHPWRMSKNVSMLAYKTGKAWIAPGSHDVPQRGDAVLIGYADPKVAKEKGHWGEHIFICQHWGDGKSVSCDYGQWDYKRGVPSAKVVERSIQKPFTFAPNSSGIVKRVMGWVDISKIRLEESAFVPSDFVGGVDDDNPYYESLPWNPQQEYDSDDTDGE